MNERYLIKVVLSVEAEIEVNANSEYDAKRYARDDLIRYIANGKEYEGDFIEVIWDGQEVIEKGDEDE